MNFSSLVGVITGIAVMYGAMEATTDNFIQAKSSAWASRTVAQVVTDLQGDGLTVDRAGFRGIPQNAQAGNYTLVAADAGLGQHASEFHAGGTDEGLELTLFVEARSFTDEHDLGGDGTVRRDESWHRAVPFGRVLESTGTPPVRGCVGGESCWRWDGRASRL